MKTVYFNNRVRPANPISNNCSKPEKVKRYVISHNRVDTTDYWAYSQKKSGTMYNLKLVDGTTVKINEQYIVSITPMLLVTIVADITPWRNYYEQKCNKSIETRKFAISEGGTAQMVAQNQESTHGYFCVQTIAEEN